MTQISEENILETIEQCLAVNRLTVTKLPLTRGEKCSELLYHIDNKDKSYIQSVHVVFYPLKNDVYGTITMSTVIYGPLGTMLRKIGLSHATLPIKKKAKKSSTIDFSSSADLESLDTRIFAFIARHVRVGKKKIIKSH